MGNRQSSQEPVETQSIIIHDHQHYNTQVNERSEQQIYVEETRILSNNLNRHINPEDHRVYRVVKYEEAASSRDPNKKSLRIFFDRTDSSAPLALTLDNISMLFTKQSFMTTHPCH